MDKRKIIIDTDPGIDDAVALAIALFSEELDVQLITTVAGNVSVSQTTENALKLLEFFEKEVPVAKGANKPLIRQLETASNVHGESGMDGFVFEMPIRKPLEENAVEAMRRVITNSNEKITLVPIGPLTNIALLLECYPEVKENIEEIVLMGGSTTRGNMTVMGEFNIAVDPEAARIVFKSGLPIVMCGLDVGWKALVYREDTQKLKDLSKTGNMLYSLFKHYRGGSLETGLRMYDSCAMAYLLKPELFTTQDCFVDVETQSQLTLGCTVVDIRGYMKQEPNTKVCLDIDGEGFRHWMMDALSKTI